MDLIDREKREWRISMAIAAIGTAAVIGGGSHAIKKNIEKITTPLETTYNKETSSQLLKAAFQNDLEGFKSAIEKIKETDPNLESLNKIVNERGDNFFTLAVSRVRFNDGNVALYALNNDEIRNKIDFKHINNAGMTAEDIVAEGIERRARAGTSGKPERPATEAQRNVQQKIKAALAEQIQQEAKGQVRSNTILWSQAQDFCK